MNLNVFNRVNVKDSGTLGMYSEWASLCPLVQNYGADQQSVLDSFPPQAGKDVVVAVVKQLTSNLSIKQPSEPSPLITDKEVEWTMQVICHGLSLPITEHDTVRDCVSIYCDWLSALNPPPKISCPKPVLDDPNLYACKMIGHLHNLFVPRKDEDCCVVGKDSSPDTMSKQAMLCHRVLRTLQEVAQVSPLISRETWEALLLFLIRINNTLLAPPSVKDDVCELLCERVVSVLVEVWLLACVKNFPSPPLWRTLRELCMTWRHRLALIEQWNRVHLALTARLLQFTYGPDFPVLKINEEDSQLVPLDMPADCVAQCWYRFLHCIGNPVDLSRPKVISQTPKFLQFAIASEAVVDPCQHPCLSILPQIFLKAIRGVAGQVDAFLGIASPHLYTDVTGERKDKEVCVPPATPTPPPQRRLAKSFSVAPAAAAAAAVSKGLQKGALIGLTSSRVSTSHAPMMPSSGPPSTSSASSGTSLVSEQRSMLSLAPSRPKCNSILHLFGAWLFEAANIGCDSPPANPVTKVSDSRKSVSSSQPNSLNEEMDPPDLTGYEAGRAEALGALCRIFAAKKTAEEVLPVYLARLYVSLQLGLQVGENRECTDVMSAILLNSGNLFRIDLDGVLILLPAFTSALEAVFPAALARTVLRQACIQILLSVISLPLHFQNVPIKELWPSNNDEMALMTVGSLKARLMNLLVDAVQVESDPGNAQMLLGGLLLAVQHSAACDQNDQPDTSCNLFSSAGSDSVSMRSVATSDRRSIGGSSVDLSDAGYDSAHALYAKAICLVCLRLISSWLSDVNVSLAALELLSGLARVQIKESDGMEGKRCVNWLCEYIKNQCRKPPPAHSKDLHSSIVAAFHCCSTWIMEHPSVLQDNNTLTTVLQVIELGISGSVSQGKPGEPVKLKDEKELKPASMRVRDAAECLLYIVLEQAGSFPSPCGAESLSSLLDETSLLKHCYSWPGGDIDRVTACQKFKYFVVDSSILLALLEEPLGNDQDPQPTVTVIMRGPFGRQVWTMQLRHLPRHKSGIKHQHSSNSGRPVPLNENNVTHEPPTKHFPDSVELIPPCRADRSIPSMESVVTDERKIQEQQKMRALIEQQSELEEAMRRVGIARESSLTFPDPRRECTPPAPCHEFQTARLFLSHFGLLAIDSGKKTDERPITMLDPTMVGFCSELEALDLLSPRTCDTAHVFYVRSGQRSPSEILNNVIVEGQTDANFSDMLLSLGWPVNVFQHPGWTGHISTGHKLQLYPEGTMSGLENCPGQYNGDKYALYWADVSAEMAFIVPTAASLRCSSDVQPSLDQSSQAWFGGGAGLAQRSTSLDLEPTRPGRKAVAQRTQSFTDPPTKVMIVWLESFEDSLTFPIGDLLGFCQTGVESSVLRAEDAYVIYLHALNSGLLRVRLVGPKAPLPVPLVDGMVIPKRVCGSLVRQTVLNICRRRRLDSDSHHPPHVRRKLKVQELANKYQRSVAQPLLLTHLFAQS